MMKKNMKIFGCLLIMITMTVLFGLKAEAAVCNCGEGTGEHYSWHTLSYLYYENAGHTRFCDTCFYDNDHSQFCSLVQWKEEHTFTISGDKEVCGCGFSRPLPCEHLESEWKSDGDKCVKVCKKCDEKLSIEQHSWKYKPITTSGNKNHEEICKDCGYKKVSQHSFTYKYTKPAQPKDPRKKTLKNSVYINASTHHAMKKVCHECGYTSTSYENHNFKGNTVPAGSGTELI